MTQLETKIRAVGIVSPGDMGHAVGRELRRHGLDVLTCLNGRSDRTKALSHSAGIRSVDSLRHLVTESDVILSILVPAKAEASAEEIAEAIREAKAAVHVVDCNAISPAVACRIAARITRENALFSDAGIIGFPPATTSVPKLYVSGPNSQTLCALDGMGITVKRLGPEIGQASGMKMCYAALTKGTFALYFALLIAADRLHLLDELLAEFEASQPHDLQRMRQFLPKLPAKATRWIGEMEQISATFDQMGISPQFHAAAASVFRMVSQSSFGTETPETIDTQRTLEATIAAISQSSAAD